MSGGCTAVLSFSSLSDATVGGRTWTVESVANIAHPLKFVFFFQREKKKNHWLDRRWSYLRLDPSVRKSSLQAAPQASWGASMYFIYSCKIRAVVHFIIHHVCNCTPPVMHPQLGKIDRHISSLQWIRKQKQERQTTTKINGLKTANRVASFPLSVVWGTWSACRNALKWELWLLMYSRSSMYTPLRFYWLRNKGVQVSICFFTKFSEWG